MRTAVVDELARGAALVHEELQPSPGSSIAIFGCAPAQLGAVLAASDRGCNPIFIVDSDSLSLLTACELGATHVVDPGCDDATDAIRSVRRRGVRFAVTASGQAPPDGSLARFGRWVSTGSTNPSESWTQPLGVDAA